MKAEQGSSKGRGNGYWGVLSRHAYGGRGAVAVLLAATLFGLCCGEADAGWYARRPAHVRRPMMPGGAPRMLYELQRYHGVEITGCFTACELRNLGYALRVSSPYFRGRIGNEVARIEYIREGDWHGAVIHYCQNAAGYASFHAAGLFIPYDNLPGTRDSVILIRQGFLNDPHVLLHELGHAVGSFATGYGSSEAYADAFAYALEPRR